ncbi:MAG TPA: UDP-glucose/GDP-mannose dehydrogenase family protein [Propionibacteriaceae bacterium]|nr:UDP-glucose/GDP-mannose dehydrogenase family protein [Propionibacteriaceae bacterium]
MRLSMIGCGYLGAVHAACMAELGHDVVGLDVDSAKVELLSRGESPFHEPGFPELLKRNVDSGRLRFTTDPSAIADAEIHVIGVGTPQRQGRYAADMTYVYAAVETVLANADTSGHTAVIAGKSTVPVGTAAQLADMAAESGKDIIVAWNPEFLREGFAVQDTLHPDRLVYGLPDDVVAGTKAQAMLDQCYETILAEGTPRLLANYPTAELVKVAANSFLATKISFINAMAELCEATGADVTRLAEAIGHDDRIGKKFLRAGIGFGGGCLPKDIRAFMARAGELGVDQALTFLREVDAINLRRRERAIEIASDIFGGRLVGRRVAVLGAAFKPDSDDLRDSPALDIATRLWARGADVVITDPAANAGLRAARPDLQVVDTIDEAVQDAEVVLVLTEWKEFVNLDPVALLAKVKSPHVIDGRHVLDPRTWADAGWHYHGLGRGVSVW